MRGLLLCGGSFYVWFVAVWGLLLCVVCCCVGVVIVCGLLLCGGSYCAWFVAVWFVAVWG